MPNVVRSIAILFHERARADAARGNYRIWSLASNWKRQGLRVEPLFGPVEGQRAMDYDVLFPHIDLSYVPDAYWTLMQAHPRCVNRGIRDIRKHAISSLRLTLDDQRANSWHGPVIIKTTNNCGGFTDAWFGPHAAPSLLSRARTRLGKHPLIERCVLRLGMARTLTRYPILPSLQGVPKAILQSPDLIVERFLPEGDDSTPGSPTYVMRMWIVMGDRSIGRILRSSDPYVKNTNGALETFDTPPPEIVQARQRLRLDYGKMDFVMHEGRGVLIDVNLTPTVTGDAHSEHYRSLNADFSRGIDAIEHPASA